MSQSIWFHKFRHPRLSEGFGVSGQVFCATQRDIVTELRDLPRGIEHATAFLLATVPLLILSWLGATSAIKVLILATAAYANLRGRVVSP